MDDDYPIGEFPPLTAADLEGSMLGKALELNPQGVYVAPALGVNFVEAYEFTGAIKDDEGKIIGWWIGGA
jgi:hypothetical protein